MNVTPGLKLLPTDTQISHLTPYLLRMCEQNVHFLVYEHGLSLSLKRYLS